jgi:hypothetical protein
VLQTELKKLKVEAENVLPTKGFPASEGSVAAMKKRRRNPARRARLKKEKRVRKQLELGQDQAKWSTQARDLYEVRMAVWALNKQSNANPLDTKLRTDLEAAYKQEQELCAPLKRKSLCERKQEEEAARAKKTGQPVRSIMQYASWHACVRHPCMVCSSSYIVVWPCFCIMLHVFIVWGHRGAGHCMKSARAWRRKMLHKRFVVFSSQLGMLVTYAHHLALVGNAFYELACFVAVC